MSDRSFLVETQTRPGRCQHNISTTKADALQVAAFLLLDWARNVSCDNGLAEQIRSLVAAGKTAEAIDLWNDKADKGHIAIHEIEFTKEDCHSPDDTGDDIRYAVEITYEGHPSHDLFLTRPEALAFVGLMLARLPAKRSIRRKVRRLVDEGKTVEALDVWSESGTLPKIEIHQIKLVQANCHHAE